MENVPSSYFLTQVSTDNFHPTVQFVFAHGSPVLDLCLCSQVYEIVNDQDSITENNIMVELFSKIYKGGLKKQNYLLDSGPLVVQASTR